VSGSPAARELDERGFTRLEGLLDLPRRQQIAARLEALFMEEGSLAGSEFRREPGARRLANLADKGDEFVECMLEPRVLEPVRHVLGARFKLSSLNARDAEPGEDARQPLHADAGAVADERGYRVASALFMLDDFTPENGALRAVPGRTGLDACPECAPRPARATLRRGPGDRPGGRRDHDNAHLWHAGTANRTHGRRLALHCFYCRSDKPQQQYQRRLLRPETQARLTPEARALMALDDPENDALSAAGEGRSGFLR
jgi:hypothetical protein